MQNPPRDERTLLRRVADLEARLRTLETAPRPILGDLSVGAALTVGTDLAVGDAITATGDVSVGGRLLLNGGTTVFRDQLSSQTTVASTASETMLCFMTIAANDAIPGAIYRLRAWGTFGVTGTPTLNLRNRLGGVGGSTTGQTGALTMQSGVTNRLWKAEILLVCVTTGASASWNSVIEARLTGVVASTAPWINNSGTFTQVGFEMTDVMDGTNAMTRDSTIANDFGLSATWSASSASNTITCQGVIAERVA